METFILVNIYFIILGVFVFKTWLSVLNYQNRDKKIPEEVNDVYDIEEYKRWKSYTMENFRFGMIEGSISFVVFLAMLIFGVFVWFNDIAESISNDARVQVLVFLGLYFLISYIMGIFTSFYDTFKIEEKYGFNKTTKKTFVFDKIKSFLLTIGFGGGLVYLILVLNDYAGNMFFLYTWITLVVIVLLVNILYTKLIIPLFNKLSPLEDGELKDKINEFAKTVGYEVTQIKVIDASKRSSKLNAFFTGFGKFKKVVLYDTLIEKMSTEEIVAVLAHEIGHSKHKHSIINLFQMAFRFLIIIGLFVLVLRTKEFSTAFNFTGSNFGFSLILFTVLLEPVMILLGLLTSYFSRRFEFQADRFAAHHYSKEHMESSLKILAKENFANLTPHPLYVKMLYSHPPIADRIKAIRKVD